MLIDEKFEPSLQRKPESHPVPDLPIIVPSDPVTFPFDNQNMQQPVKYSRSDHRIPQQLIPIGEVVTII